MRILLSAFACGPNAGSELGVGWRWATAIANAHEVVVVTDVTRRNAIEHELARKPVANLSVVYFRPWWLSRVPLNSRTAQLLYSAWQYSLLPFALRLHRTRPFELVFHLTYGVFRHPSFLGFLGAPFVFGPVGGGEDAPWRLKRSLPRREKLKEAMRTAAIKAARCNPALWLALAKTDCILCKTPQTRDALPSFCRARTTVQCEVGVDVTAASTDMIVRTPGTPFRLLTVGRLIGLKGTHLAIRAVAQATSDGVDCSLTVVGDGPLRDFLKKLAASLGILNRIDWIPHVPQAELLGKYREFDAFLFPSLHDSSSNVVLEALAAALPVICLDLGGPATLVSDRCAIVVPTSGRDEPQLVSDVASAIVTLARDEQRQLSMRDAAVCQAVGMSWEATISQALAAVDAALVRHRGASAGLRLGSAIAYSPRR